MIIIKKIRLSTKKEFLLFVFSIIGRVMHRKNIKNEELARVAREVSMCRTTTEDLEKLLIEDGKPGLLSKLKRAEAGEPGFGTIIVPKNGFSDDECVHNYVIDWLSDRSINSLNVKQEIEDLKSTLKG